MHTLEKFVFAGTVVALTAFAGHLGRSSSPPDGTAETEVAAATSVASTEETSLARFPIRAAADLRTVVGGTNTRGTDAPAGLGAVIQSNEGLASSVFYRSSADSAPPLSARAAIVADLTDGEVYWSRAADKRWPMASITKLMAAAVVVSEMREDTEITVTARDFLRTGDVGTGSNTTKSALAIGGRYTVDTLLDALLLASDNKAAEALADAYGRQEFITRLNERAREWDLRNTFFDDPSGLSSANQSTASDLAHLARHIHRSEPEVFERTDHETAAITELESGEKQIVTTTHLLAGEPYFLGGKTGYTDEAGGNLLTVFSYEERPVVVVVLGSDNRFGETERLIRWFKETFAAR